jgi:gamma-glutamylcyclotransferase (GGCT)/AIG2-like uncharacterized protein YtfP
MTTSIYYFSYGMNTDPSAMELRTGVPIPIGRALIRDHAFRFAYFADVYPKQGVTTQGVLWDITEEQLAALDKREGYPTHYDRKIVEIEARGHIYKAWMYYMTDKNVEMALTAGPAPSEYYYGMLTSGYTYFGVPMAQIEDALAIAKKVPRKPLGRPTRWFDSYEQLVKLTAGKKRLARIRTEAASQHITAEQLCADYIEYGAIRVPDHFKVKTWIFEYHEN